MNARGSSLFALFFVFPIVATCMLFAPDISMAESPGTSTPAELVATYNSLADAILGAKLTESNLVLAILATTYGHAQVELERARGAIKGNDSKAAEAALENLAADVAQLATEGDNSVASVRKRLLEGGHHHNAAGEAQGIFDEGFVIVTKAAKQSLLDASHAIGQMAKAPKADALDAEWKKVQATYAELTKKK